MRISWSWLGLLLLGCPYDPSGNTTGGSETGGDTPSLTSTGTTDAGGTTAVPPTTDPDGMTTGGPSTDATGPEVGVCSDGNVDPGEGCDDGNQINEDACTNTCELAKCGDGFVGPDEGCDDGNQVDDDACSNECGPTSCGDGVVQAPEACDDTGESAECNVDCTLVSCGDGKPNQSADEQCDDAGESASCNADCTLAVCGDGKLNAAAGETCEAAYVVDDTCAPGCERVRVFDAGLQHICMVDLDDTLHCWGSGVHGQLGQGATNDLGTKPGEVPTAPVPFGMGKIVRLALGTIHTCVLLAGGAVRCWGSNTGGQLGNGTLDNVGDGPDELPVEDLVFDPPVVDLAAGAQHTCVLLGNGRVRCWGEALDGRLGYGNLDDHLVPPDVDVPLAEGVVQIVAGGAFTCSLHADHAVRCWGNDTYGQLANGNLKSHFGDSADEVYPSEVPVSSADDPVQRLAVGYEFTCSLLQSGNIRCWGSGNNGMLGTGDTADVGNTTLPIVMMDVNLGGSAVQVASGLNHACALMATGAVKCWGAKTVNGVPFSNGIDTPGEFPPPDLQLGGEARRVITHHSDFSCALLVDGKLRCWGLNSTGSLGYGVTASIGDDEHPKDAGPVPF